MNRDEGASWRGLGRVEKVALVLIVAWALLFFAGIGQRYQTMLGLAALFMGIVMIVKIGRMALRNLIWRLRDRLIVAYVFIAVVPIVLLLALILATSYALVGQMAVYLVNAELANRARTLSIRAEALTRAPARDPQVAMTRALTGLQRAFPSFQILATGEQHFVFFDQRTHAMRLAWYTDEYVRTPDGWRIRRRSSTFLRKHGGVDSGVQHDPLAEEQGR